MTSEQMKAAQPDEGFLQQAVRLAIDNVAAGREPFGAVVVRDGQVPATGVNTVDTDADPTAHAEVAAVRAAAEQLGTPDLTGAIVYSSCEPCAMCHVTAAVAGVSRLVYAAPKELVPDLGGTPRPGLARMQAALRGGADDIVEHQPVAGADEPFRRYVDTRGGRA